MTPAQEKNEELERYPTPATWKEAVLYWAMRQGMLAVLLLVFVGMVAWVGRYAVVDGIPSVVKQIQEGYEKLEKSHREERTEAAERTASTLNKLDDAVREQTKATQDLMRQIDKGQ